MSAPPPRRVRRQPVPYAGRQGHLPMGAQALAGWLLALVLGSMWLHYTEAGSFIRIDLVLGFRTPIEECPEAAVWDQNPAQGLLQGKKHSATSKGCHHHTTQPATLQRARQLP